MTRQLHRESADFLEVVSSGGAVFESPSHSYAGIGELSRLELPFSLDELSQRASEVASHVASFGDDTVAFVSIPFSPSTSTLVIVPEQITSRDLAGARNQLDRPLQIELSSARDPKEWCDAVATAVDRIRGGHLQKVVLARELRLLADRDIDVADVFGNLRTAFSSAYRYAIDGFVGASPELLIQREGRNIKSLPLAGTRAHSGDLRSDNAAHDELRASHKDHDEHSYLRNAIDVALQPYCATLDIDASPDVLSAGNVQHLATRVSGTLQDEATTALDLVAALQPTPAVGGAPTSEALKLIAELEGMDRGRYAGAVGWVNGRGDGCFAVAIRSAQISGNRATLYAGNGIVAASDPARELTETQWKFQAMLNALVRL